MTGCSAINCSKRHTQEYITREREREREKEKEKEREEERERERKREREREREERERKRERKRGTSFENREMIRNVLFCGVFFFFSITLLNIEVS